MADEKEKRYVTIPGHRGLVRVLVSKRPHVRDTQDDSSRAGVQDKEAPTGGYLPPAYRPDEDIPSLTRPFLWVFDLATELLPGGQASYIELNPWLELGQDFSPAIGVTYSDSDYNEWQEQMLAKLLSALDDDTDPTGKWPIESSPKHRKASNTWPWNVAAMGGSPGITFVLKPGQSYPPGGNVTAPSKAKLVSVTDEDWAALDTERGLAPSYHFWRIAGHGKFDRIVFFDARYVQWQTEPHLAWKVTTEPHFSSPEVLFKLRWHVRVYLVPKLFVIDEGLVLTYTPGDGASYTKTEVVARGTMLTGLGLREWRDIRTTSESSVLDPFVSNHTWAEYGLYPAAREPLFPHPYATTRPTAAEMISRIPVDKLKLARRYSLSLLYRKLVQQRRDLDGFGTIVPTHTLENVTRRRVATNLGPPPYSTIFGEYIYGRRVYNSAVGAGPSADAIVRAEMSADMGRNVSTVPGSVHTADLTYTGQFILRRTARYTAPNYTGSAAISQNAARNDRNGQLRAIVVSGGKKHYIWRRA